jgi:hypothetical protein
MLKSIERDPSKEGLNIFPSIDTKYILTNDMKRKYHQVQLKHGWMTEKVNKIEDGQLMLKLPLNKYHNMMMTSQEESRDKIIKCNNARSIEEISMIIGRVTSQRSIYDLYY